MTEEKKARSPFAQALHDLLQATEGMDLERWTLWLNPWYQNLGPDGKPGGTSIMPMGPGSGDIFDDGPTEEQVKAYYDDLAKNWVPCHKIGKGVTMAQVQRWLDDEEMPKMEHLVKILGYLDCKRRTEAEQAALDAFDKALRMPPHEATPFGTQFRRLEAPAGCIAAHVFFERYGIIGAMYRLPMAKWEEFFNATVKFFERP
ncbi:MAG TPA: hypothetical protein VL500_05840 [Candidatus Eisenbacteria bacterium]|jgi:hypothetical protein|nr:hypothetical protein [Candidatus Eisenbacteria bacterium]